MTTLPSPELAAITSRWLHALVSANGDLLVNLMSRNEPVLFCGSDEDEIWRDDFLRGHYGAHARGLPPGEVIDETVFAFETGATGWAFINGQIQFGAIDTPFPLRVTLVFILENGIWKVQHIHNSLAISNFELLGYDLPAIDALLQAAEESDPQIGTTGSATVMFTDIVNSSALAEAVGDARWADIVQAHLALISTRIEAENGRLIKSLGDGTMSTFLSAGAAMNAARAIQKSLTRHNQEPRLQTRVGLHTGDVVHAGADFFGTVVNKAARIASVARPGEIRVSDATRAMVGSTRDFSFSDHRSTALKGLDGEHLVSRLDWDQ